MVRRSAREQTFIGGGNVGMRSEHNVDFPVEILGNGELFARGFGVDVQNRNIVVPRFAAENGLYGRKRIGVSFHEHPAANVHNQNAVTVRGQNGVAHAGRLRREIGGTDDPALGFEDRIEVALTVGVVAEGDRVHAGGKQAGRLRGVQTPDLGGILRVRNHKIRPGFAANRPKMLFEMGNGAIANQIPDG